MVAHQKQAVAKLVAGAGTTVVIATVLIACGSAEPITSRDASVSTTPTPTPTAAVEAKVTNEAGRYADYIAKKPIPAIYKPYDPKLLFYSLYVNCAGCHDFVTNLEQVKAKLEKNKPFGSLQDRISAGSMPPSKPNFATSAEGKELLGLLNSL